MAFQNPIIAGIELVRNAISSVNYKAGASGWFLGQDGGAEFDSISVRKNLGANMVSAQSLSVHGTDLSAILTPYSKGQVGQFSSNTTLSNVGATEIGIFEMDVTVDSSRFYLLFPQVQISYNSSSTQCNLRIRETHNADGSPNPPPVGVGSNQILGRQFSDNTPNGYGKLCESFGWWRPPVTGTYRFLMSVQMAGAGSFNVVLDGGAVTIPPPNLLVVDMGSYAQGRIYGQVNTGGATATPPTRYVKQYQQTAIQTYQQNWNKATVTNAAQWAYQGYYNDGNGNKSSLIFFDSASIRNDLAGATIIGSRIYLHNIHTYYNAGGTAVVGYHNYDPVPATTGVNIAVNQWQMVMAEGGSGWVDCGTLLGTQLQSGGARGICLGAAPSNDLQYYMTFDTGMMEVTYEK